MKGRFTFCWRTSLRKKSGWISLNVWNQIQPQNLQVTRWPSHLIHILYKHLTLRLTVTLCTLLVGILAPDQMLAVESQETNLIAVFKIHIYTNTMCFFPTMDQMWYYQADSRKLHEEEIHLLNHLHGCPRI